MSIQCVISPVASTLDLSVVHTGYCLVMQNTHVKLLLVSYVCALLFLACRLNSQTIHTAQKNETLHLGLFSKCV